jgi:hypothetical protein
MTHKGILEAMRRNEQEVLQHIRTRRVHSTTLMGLSWMNALDRLANAKKVSYNRRKGCYVVAKFARPVTVVN